MQIVSEICIKKINFETKRIRDTLSLITNKNLDDDEDDEPIKENDKNNEKNSGNNEIPKLPEKMMKTYKGNEEIEEFTGFIPDHLPDEIQKIKYSLEASTERTKLICAKYYTTMKAIKLLRKNEKNKETENNDQINEDNDLNDEDDNDFNKKENVEIFDINKISISEKSFLKNNYDKLRENHIIIIEDKSIKNNKEIRVSLIRFLFFSNNPMKNILNAKIMENVQTYEEKFNYYSPKLSIYSVNSNNYADIIRVYRRNKLLKFINSNFFRINIKIRETNPSNDYLNDWSSDSD